MEDHGEDLDRESFGEILLTGRERGLNSVNMNMAY